MTDFGSDISTFPDLDPTFTLISGPRVVAEAVARRLATPRPPEIGALAFAEDYGFDVRALLNDAITPGRVAAIQRLIKSECEKDERVENADVSVTYSYESSTLKISIALSTAAGPFKLTLAVSRVSDLLSVELLG